MARFLCIPIFILITLFSHGVGFSQDIRARTEDGREVILQKDGSWHFEDAAKPPSELPPGSFLKSEKATSVFNVKGDKFLVWFDPTKWTQKKSDEPGRAGFQHRDGDLYGIAIAERLNMPIETLKKIAVENAQSVAPDIKVTYEENRIVNGKKVLCLRMEGTMKDIQFLYYGYYYAGKAGSLQLITYTSTNLFSELEPEMTEFLNGLVINE